jgi:hypothetical protein
MAIKMKNRIKIYPYDFVGFLICFKLPDMKTKIIFRNAMVTMFAILLSGILVFGQGKKIMIPAYDTSGLYVVSLKNGDVVIGKVAAAGPDLMVFKSKDSTYSFIRNNIVFFEKYTSQGKLIDIYKYDINNEENPNTITQRYFFSPTAYNLKQFKFECNIYLLYLQTIGFGITDHLSIEGGFNLIAYSFLVMFPDELYKNLGSLYNISIKYSQPLSKMITIAGGINYSDITDVFYKNDLINNSFNASNNMIGLYSILTVGNRKNNISITSNWHYDMYKFSGKPLLAVGGCAKLFKRTSLMAEFFATPNDYVYKSTNQHTGYSTYFDYGIRIFYPQASLDIGWINFSECMHNQKDRLSGAPYKLGVPYLGLNIKFGTSKGEAAKIKHEWIKDDIYE